MATTRPGMRLKARHSTLLEHTVIPEFYARDEHGVPGAWVARMRESMARLTPRFSTNRAVREYTEQHYLPAAASYHERASNEGKLGVDIVNWRHALDQKWSGIRFGAVKLETNGARHVFEIEVYLDNLDPRAVQLELCADGIEDTESVPARDGAHSSTTRRSERLCLPCGRFGRPPGLGLYGQSDTTLRRRCDPTRRRSHPAAAVIRSMDDNSDEYGGDHNYLTRFAAFSRSGKSEDRT